MDGKAVNDDQPLDRHEEGGGREASSRALLCSVVCAVSRAQSIAEEWAMPLQVRRSGRAA